MGEPVAAAACVLPSAEPRRGGGLNYVIHPEPPTLVCVNATEGPAIQASTKVVEGLLAYDFDWS